MGYLQMILTQSCNPLVQLLPHIQGGFLFGHLARRSVIYLANYGVYPSFLTGTSVELSTILALAILQIPGLLAHTSWLLTFCNRRGVSLSTAPTLVQRICNRTSFDANPTLQGICELVISTLPYSLAHIFLAYGLQYRTVPSCSLVTGEGADRRNISYRKRRQWEMCLQVKIQFVVCVS